MKRKDKLLMIAAIAAVLYFVVGMVTCQGQYDSVGQKKLEKQFERGIIRDQRKAKRQKVASQILPRLYQIFFLSQQIQFIKPKRL